MPNVFPSLPLFVQNAPRVAENDVVGLPYISIFDKQAGERQIIPLVCGEGKILSKVKKSSGSRTYKTN